MKRESSKPKKKGKDPSPKYELAIFDMDGTILDTLEDLADGLNYALGEMGYPQRSAAEARSFLGNGSRRLIELGVPEGTSPEDIQKTLNIYFPYYISHCEIKTKPYKGIKEMLAELRRMGTKTAVVSNKMDKAVHELAEKYFHGCFDSAVGERPGVRKKPAPDSVNMAICRLGAAREKTVYIGDSEVDVATAVNSGLESIIVTWGFRDREDLEKTGACTIVDTVDELKKELGIIRY